MADSLKRNIEGYADPTVHDALKPIFDEDEQPDKKAVFLISVLKFIIRESGFELENRIWLKHRKTGRSFH